MECFLTKNENETKKMAKVLANECLKAKSRKNALVFGFQGDLGAGKTTFIQSFANGLGIGSRLTSPTFVLMKHYKIPGRKQGYLYHIDCYRVHSYNDILELDFKEIVSNPENIVVIEWAEKIKRILPKEATWLKFEILDKNQRKIKIL